MSSECVACQCFASDGLSGFYIFACRKCVARMLAHSQEFFDARMARGDRIDPRTIAYRKRLLEAGAHLTPPLTHEEVRAAAALKG